MCPDFHLCSRPALRIFHSEKWNRPISVTLIENADEKMLKSLSSEALKIFFFSKNLNRPSGGPETSVEREIVQKIIPPSPGSAATGSVCSVSLTEEGSAVEN